MLYNEIYSLVMVVLVRSDSYESYKEIFPIVNVVALLIIMTLICLFYLQKTDKQTLNEILITAIVFTCSTYLVKIVMNDILIVLMNLNFYNTARIDETIFNTPNLFIQFKFFTSISLISAILAGFIYHKKTKEVVRLY